jgi:hypothetical protein
MTVELEYCVFVLDSVYVSRSENGQVFWVSCCSSTTGTRNYEVNYVNYCRVVDELVCSIVTNSILAPRPTMLPIFITPKHFLSTFAFLLSIMNLHQIAFFLSLSSLGLDGGLYYQINLIISSQNCQSLEKGLFKSNPLFISPVLLDGSGRKKAELSSSLTLHYIAFLSPPVAPQSRKREVNPHPTKCFPSKIQTNSFLLHPGCCSTVEVRLHSVCLRSYPTHSILPACC